MPSSVLQASGASVQEIESELLSQVRQAEAEFRQAPEETKEQAGERYRLALDRFSHLVLDRRFPPRSSPQS